MKFTIYKQATGEIVRWGDCLEDDIDLQAQEGEGVIPGAALPGDAFYWDGAATQKEPRPGAEYEWDHVRKTWMGNLAKAKVAKHQEIEQERDRRLAAPVLVYDGKNLDAREQDIRNLEQKLATVQSRIDQGIAAPVDTLVWRDHDDQLHSFADLATYKTWLDGFAIALDERNTAAWSWSWQKKAELAACTTFDQVITLAL
jgi:hypothetical protein